MSRFRLSCAFLIVSSVLAAAIPGSAGTSVRNLPANYRHWIEAEVPYIIAGDERKEFLSLTSDQERDSFIRAFWAARNPEPSSEINTFKEEHYRRLAYVNAHFGNTRYEDGWRTEMGRIYIILGPPKQRAPYHEQANLRPMEIWFYEGNNPALPPYFYILFFKHSAAESWRIYSPRMDGPVELVSTGESQNDPKLALKLICKSVGDEVAKTTLTLIPAEYANFDNPEPTMESDIMLATLNDLPDNPLTKAAMESNRMREHVTMSVLTGGAEPSLSYDVIRDEKGRPSLSYLLRTPAPDERIVGVRKDGSFFYDFSLRTVVATQDGKAAYEQEELLAGNLTAPQIEAVKKKRFAAEARLPLAPGTYLLETTLTNNVNHVASKTRASVTVPRVESQDLAISPLLYYATPAALPDPNGRLPFSFSRLRFTPRGAQSVEIRQGEFLPVVFQLWLGAKTAGAEAPQKVHLKYVFGSVAAGHEAPTQEEEDVDATNVDAAGNFLTGRKLDTTGLGLGTYRLVVSATRAGEHHSAYASMNFMVKRGDDFADVWTAYGPVTQETEAVDDLKRGLSAQAQGGDSDAKAWFTRALAEGPADPRPLDKLVALLNRRGEGDELAALSRQPILAQTAVAPQTLLPIAQALTKNGNPKEVVRLLEAQIKLQPPNGDLYRTLADACEASGDGGRARDLRGLASAIK